MGPRMGIVTESEKGTQGESDSSRRIGGLRRRRRSRRRRRESLCQEKDCWAPVVTIEATERDRNMEGAVGVN